MTRTEFAEKWLHTFVPDLTKKQYQDAYLYIEQYLWHAFSYEVIPKEKVLSGDMARRAYQHVKKNNAIVIDMWNDDETSEITHEQMDTKELDCISEFYVVDKNWKWTYVSTHENDFMGLGPYFYKIDP